MSVRDRSEVLSPRGVVGRRRGQLAGCQIFACWPHSALRAQDKEPPRPQINGITCLRPVPGLPSQWATRRGAACGRCALPCGGDDGVPRRALRALGPPHRMSPRGTAGTGAHHAGRAWPCLAASTLVNPDTLPTDATPGEETVRI